MRNKILNLLLIGSIVSSVMLSSCKKDEKGFAPVAGFTASETNIDEGASISFTDQSTNTPASWSWDFGDGGTSTQASPSHTFSSAGTYTIALTVTNSYGSDTETKTDYITVTSGGIGTFPGQTVLVNGGTFQMGSPSGTGYSDEHPQHTVTVSSFRISKYEITNQQYADFMNAIGANADGSVAGVEYLDMDDRDIQITHNGSSFVVNSGKENYPVIDVSWYGAKAYAEYYGGRLPTEAEWEFAARGGNSSNGYTYSGSNNIDDVAWYYYNTSGSDVYPRTHTVGTKNSNELGLHDMTGNVWEWTNDWYDSNYYSNSPTNNPQGPSMGTDRVNCGGGWADTAYCCRVACRVGYNPASSDYNLGFRPVFLP